MAKWLADVFSHPDLRGGLLIAGKTSVIYLFLVGGLRLLVQDADQFPGGIVDTEADRSLLHWRRDEHQLHAALFRRRGILLCNGCNDE